MIDANVNDDIQRKSAVILALKIKIKHLNQAVIDMCGEMVACHKRIHELKDEIAKSRKSK